MGFSITDGQPGLLGDVVIVIAIAAAAIALYIVFHVVRTARDVVEDDEEV